MPSVPGGNGAFPRAQRRSLGGTRYNPPAMKFDRITFDPQVLGGRACIRGMRIPVSVVAGQITNGASPDDVLRDYPDLVREDVQQAVEYAAWLTSEQVLVE